MAESKEELKNLLMKVKEESEKASLKLNWRYGIWSHHFMANRRGNNGILGAPKSLHMVTAVMQLKDACSLEEKPWQS